MVPDDPDRPDSTGEHPTSPDASPDTTGDATDDATDLSADPDADPDAAAPASDTELRGKDLLTRTRAEVEEHLDPSTLAELSSWFDRPSAEVVEEQVAASAGFDPWGLATADAEAAEANQRRAALAEHVDPAVQHLLERHLTAADRLVPPKLELDPLLDESIISHAVRAQIERVMAAAEGDDDLIISIEPPPDIVDAIERHNTPQAILRDLARPEGDFMLRFESPFDEDEAIMVDAHREVLEALTWRPEEVSILRFTDVARACDALFRDITSEPWGDHLLAVKAMRGKTEEG